MKMGADLEKWIDIVKDCKYLPENDLKKLCEIVIEILIEESNVQPVSSPVTVWQQARSTSQANSKDYDKRSFTMLKSALNEYVAGAIKLVDLSRLRFAVIYTASFTI